MRDGVASTHEPDGRLVRRVRWRLIAWSAGSTLAVLVVLGALVYVAVAATLASSSEQLLRDRAALLAGSAPSIAGTAGGGMVSIDTFAGETTVVTGTNADLPGFAVNGPYAGTLAVVVPVDGTTGLAGEPTLTIGSGGPGPVATSPQDLLPDPEGFVRAQAGTATIRETTFQGSQVRVLSVPLPGAGAGPAAVVQVVGDRTAELRTLGTLLAVLLGGGLAALAVATGIGFLYATRALVPIRSSLQRQREFAADTSHELRTPLAIIRAGVARVRQQPDARVSDVAETLDAVDAEAVRLGALVDDLLALARTDAGAADLAVGPVDLAEVAAESLAALEPLAAGRGTRLELDVAPAPMRGDPDRLRRLVTVLVDNAIRHGSDHGHVRVTVRPGRLVVEDDGPGIATTDRERVFLRFWRGPAAHAGGSGLGLAIASWIVDRHGGRIEVGASQAGGARFTVSLPVG